MHTIPQATPLAHGRSAGFLHPIPPWLQFILCLSLGMMLSLIDRTDANWDLQNYHLYDPWALLHARLGLDYYAAGYQSYFNPLADLPYFILKCVIAPAWPRLVALLAGIPYGIMIFLVLGLSSRFVRGRKMIFIAALLGLTGTTTLSEIGTSYDDILVTDFLLAAMVCLLQEGTYPALAAGLLAGIGIALKLTAGVFALPLALYLMALPPRRARFAACRLYSGRRRRLPHCLWMVGLAAVAALRRPLLPDVRQPVSEPLGHADHRPGHALFSKNHIAMAGLPILLATGQTLHCSRAENARPTFCPCIFGYRRGFGYCRASPLAVTGDPCALALYSERLPDLAVGLLDYTLRLTNRSSERGVYRHRPAIELAGTAHGGTARIAHRLLSGVFQTDGLGPHRLRQNSDLRARPQRARRNTASR